MLRHTAGCRAEAQDLCSLEDAGMSPLKVRNESDCEERRPFYDQRRGLIGII